MKKYRKFLLFTFVATVLIALIFIFYAGKIIDSSATGLTFYNTADIPQCKTALVLGCSRILKNGRFNLFFQHRINSAAKLYKSGKVKFLIVSGDNHIKSYDEPNEMKKELIKQGVPGEKIYCDFAGFSTIDSVVRAKKVFGQNEIIVVSQKFHNRRAIFIGKQFNMKIYGFNAQEVDAFNAFKTHLREKLARVKTVLDVWILNRKPKFLGKPIVIK